MGWERPENVPYPSTWKTFRGKPHADHPPLEYRIQDLTEEYFEDAVKHMVTYFLIRENVCSSTGCIEDEVSVKEIEGLWRSILQQRMGLVALVMDPETQKERIAGVNMTCVVSKDDKDEYKFAGKALKTIWQSLQDVEKMVNVYEKYGVEHYLAALGLSVGPQYSGDGIGEELLLARTPLCQATGITLTETVFTGPTSQYLADKVGFHDVAHLDYETYKQGDSKLIYPRLKGKFMLKVKVIPSLSKD